MFSTKSPTFLKVLCASSLEQHYPENKSIYTSTRPRSNMPLIDLIHKYKRVLADSSDTVTKYEGFGNELMQLPRFTYTYLEMRTTVEHMLDLGFNHHVRCQVAAYAMRRAAIEPISDLSAREKIWRIWELEDITIAQPESDPRLRQAVQEMLTTLGHTTVEEYLSLLVKGFESVYSEVDKAYKLANSTDPLSKQTAENHGQRIQIEGNIKMRDVLRLVKSM